MTDQRPPNLKPLNLIWTRVGHDLRQPIQSLLLLAHIVATQEDREQRQHSQRVMEDQLVALQGMLDLLALLARTEHAQETLQLVSTDLVAVCRRCISELAVLGERLGVKFDLVGPPTRVQSDPAAITAVLGGLLRLSAKYARRSEIRIELKHVPGSVCVDISYAGDAITPAQAAAVFVESKSGSGDQATSEAVAGFGILSQLATALSIELNWVSRADGQQCFAATFYPA